MRSRCARLGGLGLCFVGFGLACAPGTPATPYPAEPPEEGEVAAPEPEREPGVATYLGRDVDLRPFLAGFPYGSFEPDLKGKKLFYLDRGDRYTLRSVDLDLDGGGPVDLTKGGAIGEVDWSTRSLWSVHHDPKHGKLWLHADANNDERMNLWVISLAASGDATAPVKVTDADYVYSIGFDEEYTKVAYLPRSGTKAPFSTCLHVRDLPSGNDRQVVCDTPELRFTWSNLVFSPDGTEVYFNAQVEGDRKRVQLVRVNLTARGKPAVEVMTDPEVSRSSPGILDRWVGDKLLFTSNDDGYRNLYALSRRTKRIKQLTRFTDDVSGAEVTDHGVFVAHGTPAGTTIEVVDPKSGASWARGGVTGKVSLLAAEGDDVLWTQQSPDLVFELNASTLSPPASGTVALRNRKLVGLSDELSKAVVQCKATPVQVPTFDTDPATGKPRTMHAFLLEPRAPQPKPVQLAMVRSFYGGDNRYTRFDHVMCAAGITILSPAVRGSSGFGKAYYGLNDGDLGGDEIVDLFHAARWLSERTGLPAARIGVYGRSHGGYATMRALTFPPETNGRNESYDFGFGLADAGFSDIEAFFRATNIPDWVILEAGDPNTPEGKAKVADRSPINHVDRLRAPLFILHGANDWRVPVEGSRAFVEKARAAGKPVTYVEVEGQGHHVEGVERVTEAFQARFDFLAELSENAL